MMQTKKALRSIAPKSIFTGRRTLAGTSVFAGLSAALFLAPPAFAQDTCSTTDTSGCAAVPGMSEDLVSNRFGRTLSSNPNQDRVSNRLNNGHWTPNTNVETPFNMQDLGNGTRVDTSLSDWQKALTNAERKRIEEAKEKGEDVTLPKPVMHEAPPVDVWVRTQHQSLDSTGDVDKRGDAVTTYMGADYKVNSDVLVGGMVQTDEADQHVVGTTEEVGGKAFMAGPYAAYRVTDKVIVDAKSVWGKSYDVARVGEEAADFDTTRSLSQARVSGNWQINKMQLTPSGAVTHVTEDGDIPIAGVDPEHMEETRLSIRPEIRRPIQAGEDKKIEPFAYVESSLDIDDEDMGGLSPTNKVGGGLALSKTDTYTIRATADYTDTMHSDVDPSLTGRFSVNVPLGTKP